MMNYSTIMLTSIPTKIHTVLYHGKPILRDQLYVRTLAPYLEFRRHTLSVAVAAATMVVALRCLEPHD